MSAKALDTANSSGGSMGIEQVLNLAKIVPPLFFELLDLNMLSRLVDCTLLALVLTLLDLAVDGFPIFGCAVLAEAPFLELTLVLALASDETVFCFHVGHDASERSKFTIFGGVKRAKHISVLLPGIHLGSVVATDKLW